MKVLKIFKWLLIVLGVVFLLIQLKRPARTNPSVNEVQTIFTQTQMTPQISNLLDRSCRDCHSNKTVWPWYTNVAPVSWFITDHVNEGRQHLNLSEWTSYDKDRQGRKLRDMCDEVSDGMMPLSTYTPLHPGSKPSADEVRALCAWTAAERARLDANP